ncbi:MAG: hypothetical protein V4710_00495 [Verrucomicrobiota bacterium]
MAIDTEKLLTILTAAQNPAFKKLLEERAKKQEEKARIDAELTALDEKIATSIPPDLLALLSPLTKSSEAPKSRKRKSKEEEPVAEPIEEKAVEADEAVEAKV